MADPEFLAEAKQMQLSVAPLAGEEVQKLVAGLDSGSSVRELMNTFVAMPGWLEQQGNSV